MTNPQSTGRASPTGLALNHSGEEMIMRYEMSYSDGRVWGILTTERAESSHNIPVVVVGDVAYGPADAVAGLPHADIFGETTAASLVSTWGNGSRTDDERLAADRFLSQWPAGPQLTGMISR